MDAQTQNLLGVLVPAVSGFVGAVMGGLATLYAANQSHRRDLEREQREEQLRKRAFLLSVRDEIALLWSQYMDRVGQRMEELPPGEPFMSFYPISGDYLIVYRQNAHLIGVVEDDALRQLIIDTYTLAQGLVDSFRYNNHLLIKRENILLAMSPELRNLSPEELRKVEHPDILRLGAVQTELTNYSNGLKDLHSRVKTSVQNLQRLIPVALGDDQ